MPGVPERRPPIAEGPPRRHGGAVEVFLPLEGEAIRPWAPGIPSRPIDVLVHRKAALVEVATERVVSHPEIEAELHALVAAEAAVPLLHVRALLPAYLDAVHEPRDVVARPLEGVGAEGRTHVWRPQVHILLVALGPGIAADHVQQHLALAVPVEALLLEVQLVPGPVLLRGAGLPREEGADHAVSAGPLDRCLEASVLVAAHRQEFGA